MQRTYTRREVDEVIRRYHSSDPVTSAEASKEIHALAAGRQRETGEKYSDALRYVLRKPPENYSRPETDPAAIHNAGIELQGCAENIKRMGKVVFCAGTVDIGKVNDATALRLAVLSNPRLGEIYSGHEILPDRAAYDQVKRIYANRTK